MAGVKASVFTWFVAHAMSFVLFAFGFNFLNNQSI